MNAQAAARALGLTVLERGWLSANQAVFRADGDTPAAVVDTGYVAHAQQTLALVSHALDGAWPGRIVNTHLHSDHCGGNAALQAAAGPGVETWVPAPSVGAVRDWDEDRLTYRFTGQRCARFRVEHALAPGGTVRLGPADWQVHAAPGHDMDAVMLFEPQTRTLLSGDALWQARLAIIFPELEAGGGFAATRETLDRIERLAPRWVVPGHGAAFEDAGAALAASRARLDAFEREPDRHLQHAARALVMYHLLEVRRCAAPALVAWMTGTPVFRAVAGRIGLGPAEAVGWARELVEGLVAQGVLRADGEDVGVPEDAR